jgi:hypothetical protein
MRPVAATVQVMGASALIADIEALASISRGSALK